MPLKHFRDKSKRKTRPPKSKKISITDYPIDVWYQIFLFVEEADRRKMSVCCSYFNQIFKLLPSFVKTPIDLWIHYDLSYPIHIFSTLNRFLTFENEEIIWHGNNYNIDERLFKKTGPEPRLVIVTDKGKQIVKFGKELQIHCTNTAPIKVTIKKMVDCQLWYNQEYERVYYVPGCSFKELDFVKKKNCDYISKYSGGALTQLSNRTESIIHYQPTTNQKQLKKENDQILKSTSHTTKKNHPMTNHNTKRLPPKNQTNHQKTFR